MEFEDVLEEIGGYGKFQKLLVWVYLVPASILMPGYFMSQIFMLSAPAHFCTLPDVVNEYNLTGVESVKLREALVSRDNCEMFPLWERNASVVERFLRSSDDFNLTWFQDPEPKRVACTKFTYDNSHYESTASTQWDLVCDRNHLPSLVFTVTCLGSALGTLFFGAVSDRIGRRKAFFITVVVAVVFGIASVLVTNFTAFVVLRFINATIMPQIFQLPYIILLELVGPKQRTAMLGIGWMSWTLGLCALPLAAYLSKTWIVLGLVCSSCAVLNFCYWKLIPESPRWLLSQNRVTEANDVLKQIARVNGVPPPERLLSDLERVQKKLAEEKAAAVASAMDVLRMPKIRSNFLIITFCWIANISAYHGLSLNVTNMSGNEFVNFFLLGLVEFPACLLSWWVMEKFGRRWMSALFQGMVAASCLAFCFVPPDAVVAGVVSLMVAKFACTASAMVMYQQASEVFPTPVRSFALGASSSTSSCFSICMPYIIYLGRYGTWIPFLVMLIMAIIGGILCTWLPETNGYVLCQTMEDANVFGKDQKFFSFNRIKKIDKACDGKATKEKELELMVNGAL